MATRRSSATTNSSRPGPGPARCSTSACEGSAGSGRGAKRFGREVVRRYGASGPLTLRADSRPPDTEPD